MKSIYLPNIIICALVGAYNIYIVFLRSFAPYIPHPHCYTMVFHLQLFQFHYIVFNFIPFCLPPSPSTNIFQSPKSGRLSREDYIYAHVCKMYILVTYLSNDVTYENIVFYACNMTFYIIITKKSSIFLLIMIEFQTKLKQNYGNLQPVLLKFVRTFLVLQICSVFKTL